METPGRRRADSVLRGEAPVRGTGVLEELRKLGSVLSLSLGGLRNFGVPIRVLLNRPDVLIPSENTCAELVATDTTFCGQLIFRVVLRRSATSRHAPLITHLR